NSNFVVQSSISVAIIEGAPMKFWMSSIECRKANKILFIYITETTFSNQINKLSSGIEFDNLQ
ncbi:hypothetical protein J6V86_00840, partial [bacterium]|nr:hypothetical protein [bacterium]